MWWGITKGFCLCRGLKGPFVRMLIHKTTADVPWLPRSGNMCQPPFIFTKERPPWRRRSPRPLWSVWFESRPVCRSTRSPAITSSGSGITLRSTTVRRSTSSVHTWRPSHRRSTWSERLTRRNHTAYSETPTKRGTHAHQQDRNRQDRCRLRHRRGYVQDRQVHHRRERSHREEDRQGHYFCGVARSRLDGG